MFVKKEHTLKCFLCTVHGIHTVCIRYAYGGQPKMATGALLLSRYMYGRTACIPYESYALTVSI